MAVTVTNTGPIQPLIGQEVTCGTIAGGPLDNVDVYVSGGAWDAGDQLSFRLYATVAGVVALVAQAFYAGPGPSRLAWNGGSPVHAGGTVYTLKVFAQAPSTQQNPLSISATIAGVNQSDTAPVTNASAAPVLPASGAEVTVTTAAGFDEQADISCNTTGLPILRFNLYADCGPGSVTVLVASGESGGADGVESILRGVILPVATNYTLKVQKKFADSVAGQTAPTSLATYTESAGGGGGGAVVLTGNTNGPSNANTAETFVTSVTNANVVVSALVTPTGRIYVGLNGLLADRTVFLNNTASGKVGDETIVKDEDGSLAVHNIIVDPGAGNTIDGAATYTMTAVQNGLKGSVTFEKIGVTAWATI